MKLRWLLHEAVLKDRLDEMLTVICSPSIKALICRVPVTTPTATNTITSARAISPPEGL